MSLAQRHESRSQCGRDSPQHGTGAGSPGLRPGRGVPGGAARWRLHGRGPGRRARLQAPRAQLGWRGAALVPGPCAPLPPQSPGRAPRGPPWPGLGPSPCGDGRDRELGRGRLPQVTGRPALLAGSPALAVSQANSGEAGPRPSALAAPVAEQVPTPESRRLARSGPRGSSRTGAFS